MPGLSVDFAESMRIGFLLFNAVSDTPFKDPKVRQAVAHAIDRQAIVDNLVGEASRVLHSVCYPSQVGCTEEGVKQYDYDPEKAKKLLAEAGYPNGFSFDSLPKKGPAQSGPDDIRRAGYIKCPKT